MAGSTNGSAPHDARTRLSVLHVEDNPGDAKLFSAISSRMTWLTVDLTHATRLEEAIQCLSRTSFALIALDLGLPDSDGLETLTRVRDHNTEIPVIVLTGDSDKETAIESLQAGAQDLLIKGQYDAELLSRSICYALERHNLRRRQDMARAREENQRELSRLEHLPAQASASEADRSLQNVSLRKTHPPLFASLSGDYDRALTALIEKRECSKTTRTSEQLQAIARRIGRAGGGPDDVLEIHTQTIRSKWKGGPHQEIPAYLAESRIAVLELMGHVAAYYRNRPVPDGDIARNKTEEGGGFE